MCTCILDTYMKAYIHVHKHYVYYIETVCHIWCVQGDIKVYPLMCMGQQQYEGTHDSQVSVSQCKVYSMRWADCSINTAPWVEGKGTGCRVWLWRGVPGQVLHGHSQDTPPIPAKEFNKVNVHTSTHNIHTLHALWLCAIMKCDKTNIQSPFL